MLYPLSSDGGVEVLGRNLEKCYGKYMCFGGMLLFYFSFTKLTLQCFRGLSKRTNRLPLYLLRVVFPIFTPKKPFFAEKPQPKPQPPETRNQQ